MTSIPSTCETELIEPGHNANDPAEPRVQVDEASRMADQAERSHRSSPAEELGERGGGEARSNRADEREYRQARACRRSEGPLSTAHIKRRTSIDENRPQVETKTPVAASNFPWPDRLMWVEVPLSRLVTVATNAPEMIWSPLPRVRSLKTGIAGDRRTLALSRGQAARRRPQHLARGRMQRAHT